MLIGGRRFGDGETVVGNVQCPAQGHDGLVFLRRSADHTVGSFELQKQGNTWPVELHIIAAPCFAFLDQAWEHGCG